MSWAVDITCRPARVVQGEVFCGGEGDWACDIDSQVTLMKDNLHWKLQAQYELV